MRVLWLSATSGLLNTKTSGGSYNGGGWISSLQTLLKSKLDIQLGLAFIGETSQDKYFQDGVIYYSIPPKKYDIMKKLSYYYYGYKHENNLSYRQCVLQIIEDFNPDIIHLFGIENQLACILGETKVPIVVHIQGILNPCSNAFWPVGFSRKDFLYPISKKEWLFRNGFLFTNEYLKVRSLKEQNLLPKVKYFMGRTHWDKALSILYSPYSSYYHVNEVLRDVFYDNAGKWTFQKTNQFTIVSTISETVYKGLDLILKTCSLLKSCTDIKFQWQIIGLSSDSRMVEIFEKKLNIKSCDVNIKYMGVVDSKELCNLELKSHLYVHPSYIDNSPNSLCEAQLLGLPVIATNVGGIPSLVENFKTGILVGANDPFLLASEIKQLLSDPQSMVTLGHTAYNTALSRHSKQDILQALIKTYEAILSSTNK